MTDQKSHDGEEILEPELPIIDTQHHFYDRPGARYLFDDLRQDVEAGHHVVATVYVETQAMSRPDGPDWLRPIGEVEFANGIAAMSATGDYGPCRVAAGIVGHADLRHGDRAAELLDRAQAAAPERFRGVRHLVLEPPTEEVYEYFIMAARPVPGLMRDPAFRDGFRHLAPRGLTFDASVFHHQLSDLAELARDFEDTVIVLEHMGLAFGLGADASTRDAVFEEWRSDLQMLARQPNVMCKIGGLGMPFWGFGLEEREERAGSEELASLWGRYVETAVEAFGVERCMMESNYPPDRRSCDYVPLWNALKRTVQGCSAPEKRALFHDTAARVYRLHL